MSELDCNKLAMYQMALKSVRKAGYPETKDRVWDAYVALSIGSGIRGLLDKHKIEPYLSAIGMGRKDS